MRAYVGFGDLGQQIHEYFSAAPTEESILFDDLALARGEPNARPFADFMDPQYSDCDFYVCLGYRHRAAKLGLIRQLADAGRRLPPFVHPSCVVCNAVELGQAAILYPGVLLDLHVKVGMGVVINNAAIVSHDVSIGDGSFISPGVTVCGNVSIGERTFIGAGAVISDVVKIGDDVTIGVGTVVTGDVESGVSVIGNPMRVLDGQLSI